MKVTVGTNNYSVNMSDLGEATSVVASVASQTGVTIKELSAVIGTASATTKKSGSEAGTAIRSIFMNLQNLQSDKITGTFDNLGISMTKIVDGSKELKTPVELLKELADAWEGLNSIQISEINTNIFGKRQANIGDAILENWDTVEEMMEVYSNGLGSAEEEAQKSANNITGLLNKISNNWSQFVSTIATGDGVKGILGWVNILSSGILKLSQTIGGLPTAGLLATTIFGAVNVGNIKEWISGLSQVQTVINSLANTNIQAIFPANTGMLSSDTLNKYATALVGLDEKQAKLALSTTTLSQAQQKQVLIEAGLYSKSASISGSLANQVINTSALTAEEQKAVLTKLGLVDANTKAVISGKTVTKAQVEQALALQGVVGAESEAIIANMGLATSNATTTASFGLFTKSIWANIKAMATWLITNPVGWAILATGAIYGLVKGFDALTVSLEEQQKITATIRQEYDDVCTQLESLTNETTTAKERIDELQAVADGGTISLVEAEELTNLKQSNVELEKQIALLKAKKALDEAKLRESVKEEYNKEYKETGYDTYAKIKNFFAKNSANDDFDILVKSQIDTEEDTIKKTIESYQKLSKVKDKSEKQTKQWNADYAYLVNEATAVQGYIDNYGMVDETSQGWIDLRDSILNATNVVSDFGSESETSVGKSADSLSGLDDDVETTTNSTEKALTRLSSLSDVLDNSDVSKYVSSFTSGIKTISSSLSNLGDIVGNASEISNLMTSFLDFDWANYNLNDVESLKEALNDLADEELSNVLGVLGQYDNASGLTKQFDQMVYEIHNVKEEVKGFNDIMSEMSKVTSGISGVNSAFKEFKENGSLSYDTIVDLQSQFKETTGWQDFVNIATKAGVTTQELDSACDTLIDTYLRESGVLDDITLDTVDLVSGMLQEKGVVNSLEVVLSALGLTTEEYGTILAYCRDRGIDLTNATLDEIVQLTNLETMTQNAKTALAQFGIQKQIANGITLNTNGDIQNLISLVETCGGVTTALSALATAKKEAFRVSGDKSLFGEAEYENLLKQAEIDVQNALNGISEKNGAKANYDYTTSDTSKEQGQKKTSTSSGNKTTEINNIEQALKLLETQVDKTETALSNLESNGSDNYYVDKKNQIESLNESLATLSDGYKKAEKAYDGLYEKELRKLNSKTANKARGMIESGSYDVSTFDSETAEIINKAKDYYNDAKEYSTKIAENEQTIKENSREINNSELERLGILLDTTKLQEESATNVSDKNDALDKEIAILEQQSKLEQENALSEQESNKIRLDYEQQIAELRQTKHQNNADDYQRQYDSLEDQRDGSKTYAQENQLIDQQLKLRKKIYNQELLTLTTEEEKARLLEQYNKDVDELTNQKLTNQIDAQSNYIDLIKNSISSLEKEAELQEAIGATLNEKYYNQLIAKQNQLKSQYASYYTMLKTNLSSMVRTGEVSYLSSEWYEQMQIISQVGEAITDCDIAISGYKKSVESIKYDKFSKIIDVLDQSKSELSDFAELLGDNLVGENGIITEDGITAIELYGKQITICKAQVIEYSNAIQALKQDLAQGKISQEEYNTSLYEYQSAQRSLAKEMQSLNESIYNIKIEQLEAQNDAYQKSNNLLQENIDKEYELWKAQRKTTEQTNDIAKLKAKIAKLELSDSASDRSLLRELKAELQSQLDEQEESNMEDLVNAKKDALDEESKAYEDATQKQINDIQSSSDKQEQIVSEMLATNSSNYSTYLNNISDLANTYSITMSDSLSSPWNNATTSIKEYIAYAEQAVNAMYSSKLGSATTATSTGSSTNSTGLGSASVGLGIGGIVSNTSADKVLKILQSANGVGAGTSDLNSLVKGNGYNQLSYQNMSDLSKLLGMGNITADQFKDGGTELKNKLMKLLISYGYLSATPHFDKGGLFENLKGKDDGLAWVKTNELYINSKQSKGVLEVLKNIPTIANLSTQLTSLKDIEFSKGGIGSTLDIQNLINIQGDVNDQSVLDTAIDRCRNEVIPIINDYLRKS